MRIVIACAAAVVAALVLLPRTGRSEQSGTHKSVVPESVYQTRSARFLTDAHFVTLPSGGHLVFGLWEITHPTHRLYEASSYKAVALICRKGGKVQILSLPPATATNPADQTVNSRVSEAAVTGSGFELHILYRPNRHGGKRYKHLYARYDRAGRYKGTGKTAPEASWEEGNTLSYSSDKNASNTVHQVTINQSSWSFTTQ